MRRALRVFGACALLGGCNAAFGLEPVVAKPDAPPPACTNTQAIYDSFDEPPAATPCASFGYNEQTNCTTRVANSQLIMTPTINAPDVSRCGCGALSALAFTPLSGTFVEVSAVGMGPKEYTLFVVYWEGAGGISSVIQYGSGAIYFSHSTGTVSVPLGSVPFDANARWWRIRPTPAGDAILGEASPDGATWTTIGIDPVTPPAQIRPAFVMGTFAPEPTATTATIEGLDVCP